MTVARLTPAVSVVVPAHNEAENLPILLREIAAALAPLAIGFEMVVIDDCSSDATPTVLRQAQADYPSLRVYRLSAQSGQSAALAAGFDVACGDVVVTLDADLQNDPADIPRLLAGLREAEVVIGWRRDRRDPLNKRVISKVANFVRNALTGESVRDTGCGLKAFQSECLRRIHRFDGMHRFFPTLVKMYGYRVTEVPVHHRPRTQGRTHYNIFNRSLRPMMDLLAVRWLQRRTLRYQFERQAEKQATVATKRAA